MYSKTSIRLLSIFGLSVVLSCSKSGFTTMGRQYDMNDQESIRVDSTIYLAAEPYRSRLQSTMSEVLCVSANPMERGNPEGRLGNFVADVCLVEGNSKLRELGADSLMADFVVLNNGGLRKALPKGNITIGDMFEVMPFENRLILFTMTGKEVMALCDFIATLNGTPVAGIRFNIRKKDNTATDIMISGRPLDPDKSYSLFTADYLANGGDKFPFTRLGKKRLDTGLKMRDALIENCRRLGGTKTEIHTEIDGRIDHAIQ